MLNSEKGRFQKPQGDSTEPFAFHTWANIVLAGVIGAFGLVFLIRG